MIRTFGIGRLTDNPDVRENCVTFTIATDRYSTEGNKTDFIRHVAFGHKAEFASKYLKKGSKVFVTGHIQTGSYEKDGRKVYTTDVIVDELEFCESKKAEATAEPTIEDISIEQAELPFK